MVVLIFFIETSQLDDLGRDFHLDTDIILHIVQTVTDQIKTKERMVSIQQTC
jgi:hypothetical protein